MSHPNVHILETAQRLLQEREYDEFTPICELVLKSQLSTADERSSAHALLAHYYFNIQRYPQSMEHCEQALQYNENNLDAINLLTRHYLSLGDKENTERYLEKAFKLNKGSAAAWVNQSMLKKYKDKSDSDIQTMEKILENATDQEEIRSLHFALGKIYDDVGNYEKAIDHFFKGNEMAGNRFSSWKYDSLANKSIDFYNSSFLNSKQHKPADSDFHPIFIVGMPRSGTSLVEHILSCHSHVFIAGEIPDITNMLDQLPELIEVDGFWNALTKVTANELKELSDQYKERLQGLMESPKPFTVDKSPLNFNQLGFIAMLFPQAKIIHMKRHPGDTCVSCFSKGFPGHDYTKDSVYLGYYYRRYIDLMNHWETVLPKDMLRTQYYELLTHQPEEQIKELLAFCGLSEEKACFEHHKKKHYMPTASLMQTNQPIYTTSHHRWDNYRPWLQHMLQLDDLIDAHESVLQQRIKQP